MRMAEGLDAVKDRPPENFHDAMQLFWLYALLAGGINYGRLDDYLGPYLARDLETGVLSEDEAYEYIKSLWTMIENRRTTVNGRRLRQKAPERGGRLPAPGPARVEGRALCRAAVHAADNQGHAGGHLRHGHGEPGRGRDLSHAV